MPRIAPTALALVAAVALVLAGARNAEAQEPIRVISNQPTNDFPRGVSFSLTFSGPADVKEVRLQYELAPDGTGATAVASCTGSATITCTRDLVSGAGITIIPGAEITYHWDIEDVDGGKLSTENAVYIHEDTRFNFETLTQGNITLYYHSGDETQARSVLEAADQTMQEISALERTEITFPVKVFLYATADEMQPAIAPGGPGRGLQILGEVVYSDTAMVSADRATLDITRHEIAHIVTRQATKGPFGVASWMNEGISVYAQSRLLDTQETALDRAIKDDRVLTFKELNSSASGSVASTALLFYGQSGSIIEFLVETYGAEKFGDLIKIFKDGSTPDKAFEAVYGFDQLGMENAWRASVGLGERSASATVTPQATQGAIAAVTSAATTSDSSGSDSTSIATIAIIVVLALLLLAVIAGAAMVVRRRL